MAERFYPMGLTQEQDLWKTSYEVQNEMRSFERSAYPPGTAVHLPGSRDKFGYSNPGPLAHRLTQSELAMREDVDNPHPRAHLAIPRIQVPDDRVTFMNHDVTEMLTSYDSPVARSTLSPSSRISGMSRTRSLPAMRTTVPPRLSQPEPAVTRLEDEHFSYFIPKGMQREGRDKLRPSSLSRLQKTPTYRISFPHSGAGTGFRSQSGRADWFPNGSYRRDMPSATQEAFRRPAFHRMSPLTQAAALNLAA